MKKTILVYFILFMMCGLHLLIPEIAIGQSLAKEVFDRYNELFRKPDINRLLPDALRIFNKSANRDFLYPMILELFVEEPNYLSDFDREFDSNFINLLIVDEDLQKLFYDEQFYKVLKNPTETEQLMELIENIQIPSFLEIVSGNQQIGKPNTPLSEPFVVVVKDQNGIPLSGIIVTFHITIGNGHLSDSRKVTNHLGEVETILTFGSSAGRTWITVGVDGILEKQVFTATAIGDAISTETPTVPDTSTTTNLVINFTPTNIVSPPKGDKFSLIVNIEGSENITGYEFVIEYDPTILKYDITTKQDFNGDFLPNVYQNVYPLDENSKMKRLRFIAASSTSKSSGDGNLAILTFEVLEVKMSIVTLIDVLLLDNSDTLLTPNLKNRQIIIEQYDTDVNNDGVVNEQDLLYVSSYIGSHVLNSDADVNKDEIVNILDYKLVAEAISETEEEFDIPEDVNKDGVVNILDLVLVASKVGETDDVDVNGDGEVNILDLVLMASKVGETDDVDVNGDGEVNILDIILVAGKLGTDVNQIVEEILAQSEFTSEEILGWFNQAQELDETIKTDSAYARGLAVLKELMSRITVPGDINKDGVVNILDLILVASKVGETDDIDDVDVNGDGEVNVLDLILVAGKVGENASAPSLYSLEQLDLSATDIQELITQIKAFQINGIDNSVVDPAYQRGIVILEDLLESLIQAQKEVPQKTALFVNYPNPFNPETWIPYQLGEATDVTVTIHAMNGSLVRRLALGHQVAGMYRSKNRAAYWDGRNALGEPVANGLYFYTLTAGNYSATGKMLIRK